MARHRLSGKAEARLTGRHQAREAGLRLGARIRAARKHRGWSQRQLGDKVGLGANRIGQIEAGNSAGAPFETWFAVSYALGLAFTADIGRDALADPADAGHLKVQELALRLGRATGRSRTFELATRPLETGHSIDACLRDDRQRTLIIEECWNTIGNVNASVRSTRRKMAEAEQLSVAIASDGRAYRIAAVWIVRDTRANRQLLARYPEVFGAAFPGSSAQWVRALTTSDVKPPAELGLVWCDVDATRLFAWRRRG